MGVELREPGRWMRDEHTEGIRNVDSARTAKQDGQTPAEKCMGRTIGVDGAYAASSGNGVNRWHLVQTECLPLPNSGCSR